MAKGGATAAARWAGIVLAGLTTAAAPPAETAAAYADRAEAELAALLPDVARARWLAQTYVNDDTERLYARLDTQLGLLVGTLGRGARPYRDLALDPTTARRLALITARVEAPSPADPASAADFSAVRARLLAANARRAVSVAGVRRDNYGEVRDAMEKANDPAETQALWTAWADSGAPLRTDYQAFVALSNRGARDFGFRNTAELWQSANDTPARTVATTRRLWQDLRPLYVDLHCYVRDRLNAAHGDRVQRADGPIRIDLTRNPVGMYWRGLAATVVPGSSGVDTVAAAVDRRLAARAPGGAAMARYGEDFYRSLGYPALPNAFWARSLFDKPLDHVADCSGSATQIDRDDVRLKFCTPANLAGLRTAVHEVGHVYYALAYQHQPLLYREGASDAFHEAVADFPTLSMTPQWFVTAGLADAGAADAATIERLALLERALERLPLLAFAVALEEWRWGVFDGTIKPEDYNRAWWRIVRDVQGLAPPGVRSATGFDAAAVPHVPNNMPYNRYFFANLLQHQFHAAACRQIGWKGPLHRCSVYGSTAVGARLRAMSALGASRPWPDALESFTGERDVSAAGLLAYYAPLRPWLTEQLRGRRCDWTRSASREEN